MLLVVVVGACARESGMDLTQPVTPEQVRPEPGTLTGSPLDAVEPDHAATFQGSRRELADLLLAPAAFPDGMRLAQLQVDDPNGTGRIDGRWYDPRLRTQDCAINVDTPPMPTAQAVFIPGDPAEKLAGDDLFASQDALLEAPLSLGIEIQMFDEATQRDGFAEVMIEFYRSMGDLECDAFGSGLGDGDEVTDLLVADMTEVDLYDAGYPGFAFETDGLQGHALVSQYSVGDRLLLTVSVGAGGFGSSDAGEVDEVDPQLARLAIQSQIDKLAAAGFT